MYEFIQNNIIWLSPVISIILTIVIKISSKPSFLTLELSDYLDFGFDLSISAIILLLTGINAQDNGNNTRSWLLFLSLILIFIISNIINRIGWNKETNRLNLIGIILPDIFGIILLVISTLYLGGVIK